MNKQTIESVREEIDKALDEAIESIKHDYSDYVS